MPNADERVKAAIERAGGGDMALIKLYTGLFRDHRSKKFKWIKDTPQDVKDYFRQKGVKV